MKNNDRKKMLVSGKCTSYRRIIIIVCLTIYYSFCCPFFLKANAIVLNTSQQQSGFTLKGKTTDAKGVPLPGVTVQISQTSIGTVSDNNGEFSLQFPGDKAILTFSFVGFKTISRLCEAGKPVTIRMEENVEDLDEAVVVAYARQRKDELMGSVATVNSSKLQDRPSSNPLTLAKGQLSGVRISTVTGDPSGEVNIRIRNVNDLAVAGNRNPLFVIDGVIASDESDLRLGNNPLSAINPNDIESMTVLKDAASAGIYGSRAANGIVIITTKQGQYNQKPQVTANLSYTTVFSPALPDRMGGKAERLFRLQAMQNFQDAYYDPETNTYKYPQSYEEAYLNGVDYNYFWGRGNGADMRIYQDSLNRFYNNSTDLWNEYFKRGFAKNANIQIRGGASNINYSVGLGYYKESGTLKNTDHSRISAFSNLGFRVSPKISGNFRTYLTYQDNSTANKVDMFNVRNTTYSTVPDFLINTSTVLPGKGTKAREELTKYYDKTREKNYSYTVKSSFDLTWQIITGLSLKSSVAVDYVQNNINIFKPAALDEYSRTYSSGNISRNLMILNENLLTYSRQFNNRHNVEVLLGFSTQSDETNNLGGYGLGTSDYVHYVPNTASGPLYDAETDTNLKDFTSDYSKSTMVGIFGRATYNYQRKYFVGATLRRDASSRFGENVRWAWFPSYFAAWTFSKEKFMGWAGHFLDYGKLRLSYGKSGRIFEYPYAALGELQQYDQFLGKPTVCPQWYTGATNRNLTWEKTSEYDFGVDLEFFNKRLSFTFDYFNKKTAGLVYNRELPGSHTGYYTQYENMFGIRNEGIEFEIKTDLIRTGNLTWNLSFNISKSWNKLEKSLNDRDFQNTDPRFNNNISVLGKGLFGIFAYPDQGIYQEQGQVPYFWENGVKKYLNGAGNAYYRPGDRIFYDTDENGQIYYYPGLADDRIYIGTPLPKAQGGFSTVLTYKGFDFNAMFNYELSKWILNSGKGASLETSLTMNPEDMARPYFLSGLNESDFWTPSNPNAIYPANRMNVGLNNFATNIQSNTQKISFLKLQAITLGYTLPTQISDLIGMGIRVYVTGENLLTWTNADCKDPEAGDILTGNNDLKAYPTSKRFTVGLIVNF